MGIFFLRSFVIWSTLRSPAAQKPEYKHQQIRHLLHWLTCTPLAHLDFFFPFFFFEKGLCTSDMTWCHYLLCQHHPKALISQFMMYCRDKNKTADSNALYKNKTSYHRDARLQLIILIIGRVCDMFTADGRSRQMFCPNIYNYFDSMILCEVRMKSPSESPLDYSALGIKWYKK